jgi:hypothetical protein
MINQLNRKCIPLVALTLLMLSACSWDRFYQQRYVVTSIPAGAGRAIVISTDQACEISCSIYYEVKVGDETAASTCRICSGDADSLTFHAVYASGGNLVGVYEDTQPNRLLLLHDFNTGWSWPRSTPTESSSDTDSRAQKLLDAFQKDHPDRNFTLSWGEACGVRRLSAYGLTEN